jgi:Ser/Thr protein kinase RdoA (MazF antagonist)
MKNQRERIKNALLRGEKLTRIEAQNLYGVGRLAARIEELSKEITIEKGWRIVPTMWDGHDTRLREYWVK